MRQGVGADVRCSSVKPFSFCAYAIPLIEEYFASRTTSENIRELERGIPPDKRGQTAGARWTPLRSQIVRSVIEGSARRAPLRLRHIMRTSTTETQQVSAII